MSRKAIGLPTPRQGRVLLEQTQVNFALAGLSALRAHFSNRSRSKWSSL